jgi:hypothetical protein
MKPMDHFFRVAGDPFVADFIYVADFGFVADFVAKISCRQTFSSAA